MPSIQYALDHGAALILASHLGRPKGKPNPEMSLTPCAERLSALLGKPVAMAPDCVGPQVEAMLPKPGEVLLLENLRFHPEEEKNDPAFSQQLAALCDVYVNDAFGSAHRAHASTVGMIAFVKQAAAGLLMDKELEYLTKVTKNPERPCVAILGGAKVSDKIEVIQNLMKVVDRLMIGGAMAYTFLRARGESTGKSLVEEDKIDLAKELMAASGDKLMLPVDHVVAAELKAGAENEVVDQVPDGKMGLDIGPKTIDAYSKVIAGAKTIIWNGPMGVFRDAAVRQGHRGAGEGCGGFGSGERGGRRRFGEGDQVGRRGGQDFAHLDRRRSVAGVSGRGRTARCRGVNAKVAFNVSDGRAGRRAAALGEGSTPLSRCSCFGPGW